jgi:hypothetical protein
MWNNSADEPVNPALYGQTADKLQSLGYRYELDVYEPCPAAPSASECSPLFPDHLELATNDQFAPAAAFLGTAHVDFNPAHVTYVVDGARERPSLAIVGDHAYWVSGLTLRSTSHTGGKGDPDGQFDAVSHGFGVGDPTASGLALPGVGALTGGNLGTLTFASTKQTWGPHPSRGVERLDHGQRDQHRHRVNRRDPRARGLVGRAEHHDRWPADRDVARLQPHGDRPRSLPVRDCRAWNSA